MVRELTHFIGGKHTVGTSGLFGDVYDPNTGAVQAHVPLAGRPDTEAAIADAAIAQREWGQWNPQRRARVLLRFLQLAEAERDSLTRLLSAEHGKTVADAHGDIQRGLEVVEFAAGFPHLLKGEFSDNAGTGIDVRSLRSPLGVVAGITPFNFPAMIPLWKAAPALACGNAFVLKPSAHIYATAAAHGKRAQCFGGAKNHMIVMPDADLDQAVDALIGAGYGSAGERCMAISVAVPVGRKAADALVAALKERVGTLRIGRSDDPSANFGPLVSRDALDRVRRYVDIGVNEGAELVVDGRNFSLPGHENGFFAGASLFDRVTPQMRIYREEIFGPVLCVARAADYEEALRLPSEHPYGNGVAIFTRDGDTARDFTRRVNTGMVGVNVPIPVPVAYHTFGGWKRSAFGDLNQHGPGSVRFCTRTKTVTSRWPKGAREGASFTLPTMG
ncbi:aldehyde dehydrogenase family protein [Streptomyces odonnellii]|uniref:aldehyde dehydrogenase family protein n=1 Tax=Streptomyces odonnellii TaxID=1417980 RepID=UPI0006252F1B|nr:aldehyde dehydrogenase family protein [Streptomyces odonnellii]